MILRHVAHGVFWLTGVPAIAIMWAHIYAGLAGAVSVAASVPDVVTVLLGLVALGLYVGDQRYVRRRRREVAA